MTTTEHLITNHLDVWSSVVTAKSSNGRGKNQKLELYGLKKLRELILELAVRGLLVPQDPTDEPASMLLKTIAAEKARLVKEGKIKKPKKLPPISENEKPFDLPEGWEWCKFGDIYSLEYGKNLPESKRSGTGEFPVYGSNGVVGSHNESCVKEPCIIVGRKGSAGALNLCLDNECWVTDVAYSVIPPSNLNIEFIFKQFHTLGLDKLGKGIKPGLNRNEAYMLNMAMPPFPEQHRIVAKVDELMALCDRLEQRQEASISTHRTLVNTLLAALTTAGDQSRFDEAWARIAEHFDSLFTTEDSIDQLKQTILQLAVMGKLVPQNPDDEPAAILLKTIAAEKTTLVKAGKIKKQKHLPPISDEEKPFDLPEGWEWCRLGECGIFERGKSKHRPRNDKRLFENGVYPFVQTGDVAKSKKTGFLIKTCTSYYNDVGLSQSRMWSTGTLCITIAANIAETGFLTFDACFPDSVVGFISLSNQSLSKYVNEYLCASKTEIEKYAPATAQKNINLGIINQLLFPLPPLEEQPRIVAKVDELMALCDRLQARLRASQATRRQLADAVAVQGFTLGEHKSPLQGE